MLCDLHGQLLSLRVDFPVLSIVQDLMGPDASGLAVKCGDKVGYANSSYEPRDFAYV